jgi:hypothetical protein
MNNNSVYTGNLLHTSIVKKLEGHFLQMLILVLCFSFSSAFAQNEQMSFKALNGGSLQKSVINEKVIIKTDRQIYLCGETIFFSAITYDGNWFLPVSLSSVLYVELYNQDNRVISKGKFALKSGSGSGKILIPRSISSDIYFVRAYTNYMKNFGAGNFFMQKLKIVNPFIKNTSGLLIETEKTPMSCQIFPEGGRLITGIKCLTGCRFIDIDGNGVNVFARVIDMDDSIITTFQTYKDGFARFDLTPKPGHSYRIEVLNAGARVLFPVPEALKSGLSLSLDTLTSEFLKIRLASSVHNNFHVRLVADRGEFFYPLSDTLITSAGTYYIPVNLLPSGLSSLELIDNTGDTLIKRFIYINPPEKLRITVNTEKEKYESHEEARVIISIVDQKGAPVSANIVLQGSLSDNSGNEELSVFDNGIMCQELKQLNIKDEKLITDAVSDKELLGLILLSSSPSDNKNRIEGKLEYLPETGGDIISGRLLYKDNRPASGLEILQSFTGKTSRVESSITDSAGNFHFQTGNEKNKGDLIFKVQNTEKEVSVILNEEFFTGFTRPDNEKFQLTKDEISLIGKLFINIQVDDAFSSEKKNNPDSIDPDSAPFYGRDYVQYKFSDYAKLPNMKEFIFEVIEGVVSTRENKEDVISIIDKISFKKIGPHPLLLIDGVPAKSLNVISLDPEKVAAIRVVRDKYFYKKQVFDGILDVITLNGDALSFDLPQSTFRQNFLHTNNDASKAESGLPVSNKGRIPEYRNLLYWNPEIKTDENGKATISFYTPDNSGSFTIQCFGITSDGASGDGRAVISVGTK